MSFDWCAFGSAITGAIIGGFIAGYFALRATKNAHRNQMEQAAKNEATLIRGVLQAIHDEVETLFERYQETMGAQVESLEEGKPLLLYYPLVSDFFTVYNGNSFLIGRISDNDLRKQIIKSYTLAKGMVDSFRLNNDLIQKFEYWDQMFQESKSQIHQQKAAAYYHSLVDYAKKIKVTHQQLKSETENLLRSLRKHGVLAEKIT